MAEIHLGDPNFYAREQILEPDALARAARVKIRVRIQLIHHRRRKWMRRVFSFFLYATAMFELACRLCARELSRAQIGEQ